jgi:transcriptional regulator with XRE-family HTH domain
MTAKPESSWAERLGFARLLYHLDHGVSPTNKDIADAAGRSHATITAWMVRADAPPFYDVRKPLAAYFGVDESWLFEGEGIPREPDLWKQWIEYRRSRRRSLPS